MTPFLQQCQFILDVGNMYGNLRQLILQCGIVDRR